MDVENLYPSIDVIDLIEEVKKKLVGRYGETKVKAYNKFFHVSRGVPTGGAKSVSVGNLYLAGMDDLVFHLVVLYKRYIDDLFLLVEGQETVSRLQAILSDFHPQLKLSITTCGKTDIPYLDLEKPNNPRGHFPINSCHPLFVHRSIVRVETLRYIRRFSDSHDLQVGLTFLASKFRARGYPGDMVRQIQLRTLQQTTHRREPTARQSKKQVGTLIFKYSTNFRVGRFNLSFKKTIAAVSKVSPISVAFKIQPSLFRLVYQQWNTNDRIDRSRHKRHREGSGRGAVVFKFGLVLQQHNDQTATVVTPFRPRNETSRRVVLKSSGLRQKSALSVD
eukprot:5572219-Amphidinium_carterae.1